MSLPTGLRGALLAVCALGLGACSSATPTPTAPPPATAVPTATTVPPTPGNRPESLTIWLPPRFGPDTVTSAGSLLLERLQAFEAQHAGVQVTTRVKAESGPGGLGDSLEAASQAATGALPDLAILDRAALQTAGALALPNQRLDLPPGTLDSYEFAQTNGDPPVGVPLAADLELFAYRTSAFDSPPSTWGALFTDQGRFLIPASDPQSRFLMAQYLAVGGALDQIDIEALTMALGFLDSANNSGALAPSSLDFASSGETWSAFLAGRAQASAAPFSAFVAGYNPLDYSAGPLPTSDGQGVSLAMSWSWAVLNDDPMAQSLLAWLLDPEFLAQWTFALGLVPAQPAVLERWPDTPQTAIASRLVPVAQPLPSSETLAAMGPAFAAALRAVLTGELTPPEAAAMAAAGR